MGNLVTRIQDFFIYCRDRLYSMLFPQQNALLGQGQQQAPPQAQPQQPQAQPQQLPEPPQTQPLDEIALLGQGQQQAPPQAQRQQPQAQPQQLPEPPQNQPLHEIVEIELPQLAPAQTTNPLAAPVPLEIVTDQNVEANQGQIRGQQALAANVDDEMAGCTRRAFVKGLRIFNLSLMIVLLGLNAGMFYYSHISHAYDSTKRGDIVFIMRWICMLLDALSMCVFIATAVLLRIGHLQWVAPFGLDFADLILLCVDASRTDNILLLSIVLLIAAVAIVIASLWFEYRQPDCVFKCCLPQTQEQD